MKSYYWTEDSFGSELPDNWEEIAKAANKSIDAYLEDNPEEADAYFSQGAQSFSDDLWERYCETGNITPYTPNRSNQAILALIKQQIYQDCDSYPNLKGDAITVSFRIDTPSTPYFLAIESGNLFWTFDYGYLRLYVDTRKEYPREVFHDMGIRYEEALNLKRAFVAKVPDKAKIRLYHSLWVSPLNELEV